MSWCLPFIDGDDLALTDHVTLYRRQEIGPGEPRLQVQVRVERIHDEVVVMRLPRRGRWTAVNRTAETGDALDRTGDLGGHRRGRIDRNRFGQAFRWRRNAGGQP